MLRDYHERQPQLGRGAWVDDTALVLGDVTLGEDASVWPMAVLRGDVHRIEVGARTNIQDGSVVHVAHDGPYSPGGHPAVIGADVTVGHNAVIHACRVGDLCLVGIGATILDGAELGPESILGAGALVPPGKSLEGGHLYRGNPALPVRPLRDSEREHLRYSARHYVDLKDRHRAG